MNVIYYVFDGVHVLPYGEYMGNLCRISEADAAHHMINNDHARISAAIDASAHAARIHVRRSIGQQFRRAREELGVAR